MAERFNAPVLKTGDGETRPGVRIPPPPFVLLCGSSGGIVHRIANPEKIVGDLPYKIATLVYIFNSRGQLLLLHRIKPPNQHLYSPVGGKLEQAVGESPYQCAVREVLEETGASLTVADIRLCGIVSERSYEGRGHWLMFCFESLKIIELPETVIAEGRLEWVLPDAVNSKAIPDTDRQIIWPLVRKHSVNLGGLAEVFSVHIDCRDPAKMAIMVEHPHD